MKVLVTGASGFIGREIVEELRLKGCEIIELAGRKPAQKFENLQSRAKVFFADISKPKDFAELENIRNVDAVVHSAGLAHQFGDTAEEEFQRINVRGTKNVVELAVRLKAAQFILIGSTAVYGIKKSCGARRKKKIAPVIDEETECAPQTFYAQSKLEAESVCREICEKNNIALTILRLAPVIGEGNVGNVSRLIELIDKNRFLWVGRGENLKSLIYKRDAAKACAKILSQKSGGTEIFNLAAKPVRMDEFVADIGAGLNRKVPKISLPPALLRIIFRLNSRTLRAGKIEKIAGTIEKWLSDDVYAGEKILKKYDFAPETSIEKALEAQIRWYKQKNPKRIEQIKKRCWKR